MSQTVVKKNAEHIAESTEPKNRRNSKCTMLEGEIDTIVSAIHLMLEPSHNAGVDFAEIVRQFLNHSLTGPEQSQFWAELRAEHPAKWPTVCARSSASTSWTPNS
jgi:hypothetical protein